MGVAESEKFSLLRTKAGIELESSESESLGLGFKEMISRLLRSTATQSYTVEAVSCDIDSKRWTLKFTRSKATSLRVFSGNFTQV